MRVVFRFLLAVVLIATAFALSAPAFASGQITDPHIEHVIIIFQENRTPDNLFQDPVLIARGADIVQQGVNSRGQIIRLKKTSLTQNYDLSHKHEAFLSQYDNGKMDGADQVPFFCVKGAVNCPCAKNAVRCPLPNPQFYYIDPAEVQPYFSMAETYTFGDRMFQNNQGPSFPAHQYIISGTATMGTRAPGNNTNLFISENPPTGLGVDITAGCTAKPTALVELIDITNPDPAVDKNETAYPCADHLTLMDLLDNGGVSWKYYTPGASSIWTGPNAIEHLCGPNAIPPFATACTGEEWVNNVVLSSKQILTDIRSSQLSSVSWVIPGGQASDHSVSTDGSGPSWVASIVNAVGNSAYWESTAIIVTWDDWGGWYDHVAPPQLRNNYYEQGFRVPLLVISPYAKPRYISHVHHDFGGILKFVEKSFGLPSLGYADSRADDLSDCFNFNQTPLVFHTIAAPLSAGDFLNDQTAPLDPDDD